MRSCPKIRATAAMDVIITFVSVKVLGLIPDLAEIFIRGVNRLLNPSWIFWVSKRCGVKVIWSVTFRDPLIFFGFPVNLDLRFDLQEQELLVQNNFR